MINNKELKLLQSVLNLRQKDLPVFHLAKVANGEITVTDLDICLNIYNQDLQEGFYKIAGLKDASYLNLVKFESEEDLPRISFNPENKFLTSFDANFADVLKKSLPFHSKDESRYCLIGAYLDRAKGCIVAADGHRLYKGELAIQGEGDSVILPTKACKVLLECFKIYGDFALEVSASKVKAWNEYFDLVFKTVDGTFPDYQCVIPENLNFKLVNLEPLKKVIKAWNFEDRTKQVILKDGKIFDASLKELGEFAYPFEFKTSFNGGYLLDILQSKHSTLFVAQSDSREPIKFVQGSDLYILMPMRG